jgi:hypothetical protein
MNGKTVFFLALIFAAIGSLCLFGFLYTAASEIAFLRHAAEMDGQVVGLPDRATDQPIFLYEFPAGTVRRSRSLGGSSSDQYLNGDRVPIYVDARDPESAQIRRFDHQWLLPLTLAVFAFLFGGIGYGFLGYRRWRRGLDQRIRDRGIRIRAEIVGVGFNDAIEINGISPWHIQAQALIDGKVRRFVSEDLWYDPSPYLERRQVDVQYLAEDPKKHRMDISFLPEFAG